MRWDLFCQVIDNHGDAGVCWRLARELAERGDTVRLWIDDPAPLAWMAPAGHPGVAVHPWHADFPEVKPGDAVIEAFGCNPPDSYLAALARATADRGRQPAWLNLEYLSAEPYVARCHGLPSPVSVGPAAGLQRHFFYPGFSARTGGLLRESGLADRQAAFDAAAWRRAQGIEANGRRLVSLFCYEPPALALALAQLAASAAATTLLVTAGRAAAATRVAVQALDRGQPGWNARGQLRLHPLPLLSQAGYDELLWACDLNFVRGEDSAVRALLAGRPFVWQLYPQADGAHLPKLEAFLGWLQPPADWAAFHRAWNAPGPCELPAIDVAAWAPAAARAREQAWALPELAAGLRAFAAGAARI